MFEDSLLSKFQFFREVCGVSGGHILAYEAPPVAVQATGEAHSEVASAIDRLVTGTSRAVFLQQSLAPVGIHHETAVVDALRSELIIGFDVEVAVIEFYSMDMILCHS